ncbi:MAG: phospho-N-acetylmuramoyl-pentapeptide-transferase [Clostridia bacterium]|nr:phospho-N-acetylmuramoyl-pentapeptide-transferase [Clostridia bacterium]
MKSNNSLLYVFVFLFTLTATVLIARLVIPFLKKRAEQPIYEDGPKWHMSKAGTPTMGGISFLIAISISLFLSSLYLRLANDDRASTSVLICAVYAILNASVGIIDDITKLKHKKNAGLTPRAKLILQFVISSSFLISRKLFLGEGTTISSRFGEIDLGIIYYFLSLIILVGITNCANLTDGIDGLATSVAFAIGVSMLYFSYMRVESVSFISASLIGATVAFLIFNIHPAKIFMGDTGSLFLGSLAASLAFELKNPMIALISGGVYVIEGVSVILQVLCFKAFKRRLFKMAPIHHHLEKCGWDENKICVLAIVLTLLFSIPVFLCL